MPLGSRSILLGWTATILLGGGILMSFHAPFQVPGDEILALAPPAAPGHWRELHFLSPSCACSQRVLAHLAARGPQASIDEQILMLDGPEPPDPDAAANERRVALAGFSVRHLPSDSLPTAAHLVGVPLLVIAGPGGKILYRGGYGPLGDQDTTLLARLRAGETPSAVPVLGCAISQRLRARVDPFHFKYRTTP